MIKLLSETVCNRICAGECIQRPASVVKELIENSIDAGATNIDIRIKDAGKSYIQVIDNGSGIPADEAYFAFERHATSKISQISDLDNISTLGFRGDALASISAVSEIEMRTRFKGADNGIEYFSEYSSMKKFESISCPFGTEIVVKNLFSNIPCKKRFLKGDSIENQHTIHAVKLLALARPDISISLFIDENQVLNYGNCSFDERIRDQFGESECASLRAISGKCKDYELSGFIANPVRNNKKSGVNHFIINKRPVICPSLHKAITKAYEQKFPNLPQPNYILNITVPAEEVDVNIRPDKGQVSLWNQDKIVSIFAESLSSIEYTKSELLAHSDNLMSNNTPDSTFSRTKYLNLSKINLREKVDESVKMNLSSCLETNKPVIVCGNDECETRNILINAIVSHSVKSETEPKVIMLKIDKIEQLYQEFEQAGKIEDWCQLLLGYDIIVIENIHELGSHLNMHKHIFWLVNELMFKHKIIIVSSKYEPEDIPSIEERLRSRLRSFRLLSLK